MLKFFIINIMYKKDIPQLHTPTIVSRCLLDVYNMHKIEQISLSIIIMEDVMIV